MTANSGSTLYDRLGVSPTAPLVGSSSCVSTEGARAAHGRLHRLDRRDGGRQRSVGDLSDPAGRARYDACIVVDDEHADSFDAVNGDLQTYPEDSVEPRAAEHLFARASLSPCCWSPVRLRVHPFMVCKGSAPKYEAVETCRRWIRTSHNRGRSATAGRP